MLRRDERTKNEPRGVIGGGSVHADEILPMRELARRMGWQKRMSSDAQKMGLRTVTIGRMKYTTGEWVLEFVKGVAARQGGQANET